MSKICVIGAGIAGTVFSRLAASRGYHVDLFEREMRVGGLAEMLGSKCVVKLSVSTDKHQPNMAGKFLQSFCQLQRVKEDDWPFTYTPVGGWHWQATGLLQHKNIKLLTNATVHDAYLLHQVYGPYIYNTAPLDLLFYQCFGPLEYHLGFAIRDDENLERYTHYKKLASIFGITSFGATGGYKIMTIEDVILESYTVLGDLLNGYDERSYYSSTDTIRLQTMGTAGR